jgi:hypothetical protein
MRALRRARPRARSARHGSRARPTCLLLPLPLPLLLGLLALTPSTTLRPSTAPATTAAAPAVKLAAGLEPERLGQGTTLDFAFQITTPHGYVPPPLIGLELRYPANLGLINSGLGLATCAPATLDALGPEGCPPDSLMGHGSALVEIPLGPEIIHETGQITTWLGPVQNGHLVLLFYAEGQHPIAAQLIFSSQVLEATAPYGGDLDTDIPIIPSLPEAPDAAVVQMNATIGSQGVTYYTHTHGKTISYHPDGLRLPHTCPHGGFPFAATFTFLDGAHSSAGTTVPCPAHQMTGNH